MNDYKTTVGIEVHAELKTKTKMFSSAPNEYGTIANSNVTVVDLGYPGTLPCVNKEAVELALKAALILNCKINKVMHFDRKNYFYPDNPKNFQVTQNKTPIGVDGYVEIEIDGVIKNIRIHDIHIEEDTAKSIHTDTKSLLDFNRAGVPLVEIVTEPDISSDREAVLYLERLRELLLYADVSDCKIEEGSMRCEPNVSVSKTEKLGTKIEVKNIGSISNVGVAVKKEEERQIDLLEHGTVLKEETRRFDDKANVTVLMRVKETGNDYRYFPEPDIPYIELTDEYIENVKKDIPMLPNERRKIYIERGISELNTNKIIQNRSLSNYLNKFINTNINLVIASNLLLGDISAYLNKNNIELLDTKLTDEKFISIVNKLDTNEINSKIFKDILADVMEKELLVDQILADAGVSKMSEEVLSTIIVNIINSNGESVADYKNGNERAIKFLMGQVMKETKGNADPKLANDLLIKELSK